MRVEITNFMQSLQEISELWSRREALSGNEKKYVSRLATALVRICLCAYGVYSPPPFVKKGEVITSAREYQDEYGRQVIKLLLHMALLLDDKNPHAYIYLVKLLRDWQYLWKEEYRRQRRNLLPLVVEWVESKAFDASYDPSCGMSMMRVMMAVDKMEWGHPSQSHRFQQHEVSEAEVEKRYDGWKNLDVWGKGVRSPIELPEIPLEEVIGYRVIK